MTDKFKRGKSLETSKPKIGGGNERPRLSDVFKTFEWPKKPKFVRLRLVGGITSYAYRWFEVKTKDGGKATFPIQRLNWDAEAETYDSTKKDPFAKIPGRDDVKYYMNALIRDIQENYNHKKASKKFTKKELKTGFKEIESDSETPFEALRMPPSLVQKIQELADLNKVTDKKSGKKITKDVSDEKYGIDLEIKFDSSKKGGDMYAIQKAERTPLTDEEKEYLLQPIFDAVQPMSLEEALEEVKRLKKSVIVPEGSEAASDDPDDEDEDYDDEDDDEPAKKKGKGKDKSAKGKKKAKDEDDDDDEDDEDDEDSDDDDEDDSDEDSDDDSDDDDNDDKPVKGKKGKSKKSDEDDDGDEDEEEEDDEDDDDDEPKSKKSKSKSKVNKKSRGKKKSKDDDDDDLDDLDEDEDEDDDE